MMKDVASSEAEMDRTSFRNDSNPRLCVDSHTNPRLCVVHSEPWEEYSGV